MNKSLTGMLLFFVFAMLGEISSANSCKNFYEPGEVIPYSLVYGDLVEIGYVDPGIENIRYRSGKFNGRWNEGDTEVAHIGDGLYETKNIKKIQLIQPGNFLEVRVYDPYTGKTRIEGGIYKKRWSKGETEQVSIGNKEYDISAIQRVQLIQPGDLVEVYFTQLLTPLNGKLRIASGIFKSSNIDKGQISIGDKSIKISRIRALLLIRRNSLSY